MLKKDYSIVKAEKQNFNEILAINKCFQGLDYLPAALNEWFDHRDRRNFVLKNSNLVIGFFSITWYRKMVEITCPKRLNLKTVIFIIAKIWKVYGFHQTSVENQTKVPRPRFKSCNTSIYLQLYQN